MAGNYPAGVTTRDIDNLCLPNNHLPRREECFLCKRMIQQGEDFDRWFVEDESGWVPTHYSDFTDAFLTEQGWCCGTSCFNDHTVDPNAECDRCDHAHGAHGVISTVCPDGHGLFLVKAVTA